MAWIPFGLQALGSLGGAVLGSHAAQTAAQQQQDAARRAMAYRQQVQQGIGAQMAPYQHLGYGALMPLAALAGGGPGRFTPPQGRSFLASSPAYAPTYQQPPQGGGFPLSLMGQPGHGGMPPTGPGSYDQWQQNLQRSLPAPEPAAAAAPPPLSQSGGATPGPQDSTGARYVAKTGPTNATEKAFVDKWLSENPDKTFGDADLNGYRNLQRALGAGLTAQEWETMDAKAQKDFLKHPIHSARKMGKGKR